MAKKPKPPRIFKPADFLRGSTKVGQKYTAWTNYNQGKPDFGKGSGPGTPYSEITRLNTGQNWSQLPSPPRSPSSRPTYSRPSFGRLTDDPRASAIRRRLGWN
jgi:hypothetical protein